MARRWLVARWATRSRKAPAVTSRSNPTRVGVQRVRRSRRRLGDPSSHPSRPVQVGHDHGDGGGRHDQDGRRLGRRQAGTGELHVGEDRQRVGVVGDDDVGAVLADGPQPGQQQTGPDARGGDRKADPHETGQRPVAEGGGQILEQRRRRWRMPSGPR